MKEKIILVCSECLSRNYTMTKNKRLNVKRLELNKYCKRCGKHTLHKETKSGGYVVFGKKAETEVVEEVERELKFKEWFNLKGIRAEIKNVHWLTKKELFNNSLTVLVFTFVMGLFFFGGDAVIAFILKALGMD